MILEEVLLIGTRGAQPLATAVAPGTLYSVTDEYVIEQSDGAAWTTYLAGNNPSLNFGPGAITSLTIVNGRITAIS